MNRCKINFQELFLDRNMGEGRGRCGENFISLIRFLPKGESVNYLLTSGLNVYVP